MQKINIKNLMITLLIVSSIVSAVVEKSSAQMDDFPPPPPPSDDMFMNNARDNGDSSGMGGSSGASGVGTKSGPDESAKVLSKMQKDKFNQSKIEEVTDENFPETIESFDFPNVDVADVIKAISELTGKNFIIDPGVRGKITILAPSKLTVAEAYKAFLSALAINGYTVVPYGNFLKVKNSRSAQRDSIDTYSGSYYPNTDQMITKIIHLKYISAEQVNRDLRILPSKDGEMVVYGPTNSIIISDYGSNIDRIMKIINQLDVPGFDDQLIVIPIKYAKAKDLADLIEKIVNKGEKSNSTRGAPGSFSAGIPRFSRLTTSSSQQGSSYFMAFPDDRTNSIIVVGNAAGITRVKKLVGQLDFRMRPEDMGGVFVYYVKYGDAEKIAQTLSGVAKDLNPKTGSSTSSVPAVPVSPPAGLTAGEGGFFGGDVKITADKNTNSLVITASKQDYDQVKSLLKKIDIPRDQVFVEAVIMEMSAGNADNWGIGYYKYADGGYGKAGFNGGIDIGTMLSPTGGNGAVLGFASGGKVSVFDPAKNTTVELQSIIGFINFLKNVTKANILSTPRIVALDNQEAEIEVGDKVVVGVNASTTATGTTNTPIFEDATIKLNIKPFISPESESIRMEIKQSVKQISSAVTPKALSDTTQPLATRSIKTNIVVNNGDTAVLGGLIKETEIEKISKVPLLGDLPILGWLFKSRSMSKDKVNMVVFLTPKILRTNADKKQTLTQALDERIEFIKSNDGRDPFGKKADDIAKKSNLYPETETSNTEGKQE